MTKLVLGFDIGGTKISAVVWDGKKVVSELKLLTPKTLAEFKIALKEMALFLGQKQKNMLVGVAVAGIVDRKKGSVIYSPNLRIIDRFNFFKFFKSLGFAGVRVENDANCFVLMENRAGQGKKFNSLIGITLGTGLGGGIIMNRNLYIGSHGSGGEPGHMMADEKYTYEQHFQMLKNKKDWKKAGKFLGRCLADILNLLDAEAVVLGGSVGRKFGRHILPEALAETKKHLLSKKLSAKIYISKIKHAEAIGAALLWEKK